MVRPRQLPQRTGELVLRHDGRDRVCLVHTPLVLPQPAPLVVELHGRGIDPLLFDRWTGYAELADEAGFVLAMPSALGGIWNDGRSARPGADDVSFLLALVEHLLAGGAGVAVDPARVYLVGMSNGAVMAGRLAWQHPERFAALAQIAGTAAVDIASAARPPMPVPVVEIHGTRDHANPYAGGRASGLLMRLVIRGTIGPSVGVDEWAVRWAAENRASALEAEAIGPDVTVRRWAGPTPASDLAFYRVEGGGHTWPGTRAWSPPHLGRLSRTIDATRVTWAFLTAHRRSDADSW